MPFNQKPQNFHAKINAVTIGSGDKTCDNWWGLYIPIVFL